MHLSLRFSKCMELRKILEVDVGNWVRFSKLHGGTQGLDSVCQCLDARVGRCSSCEVEFKCCCRYLVSKRSEASISSCDEFFVLP